MERYLRIQPKSSGTHVHGAPCPRHYTIGALVYSLVLLLSTFYGTVYGVEQTMCGAADATTNTPPPPSDLIPEFQKSIISLRGRH